MPFIWLEAMSVSNNAIDEQHKQLISKMNEFMDSCKSGTAIQELDSALAFLVDYTIKHFAAEEAFLIKSSYPGYAEHKKLHIGFTEKIAEILNLFRREGPTLALINAFNFEVGNWLMDHIAKEDRKYAEFLRLKK